MKKKVYLITGATGFVGKHLIGRLKNEEAQIHIIVRNTSNYAALVASTKELVVHVYDGTIERMTEIVENVSPDYVVHLATYFVSEHKASQVDDLMESNIKLGLHLLEAAKDKGIHAFINFGTAWQNFKGEPYNPVNLYAASKQAFMDIAKYYSEACGVKVMNLMIYDTYGEDDSRGKVLNLLKKIGDTGEQLGMTSGEQEIGLVYIEDVIEAVFLAIDHAQTASAPFFKTYYLSPESFLTLRDLAKIYESALDVKLNIDWGVRNYREREVMTAYRGDRLPEWLPKVGIEEGLRRFDKQN